MSTSANINSDVKTDGLSINIKSLFETMDPERKRILKKGILINLVIWITFSIIYTFSMYVAIKKDKNSDSEDVSWSGTEDMIYGIEEFNLFTALTRGMYFSTITHSTVGYGDVYPKKWWGKFVVCTHVFIVICINIYFSL